MQPAGKLQFKPLPFAFDALEPYIDKQTVELHYTKHHKTAYDNFMAAIKGTPMETMDIRDIFKNISKYPAAVRNNGGSTFNHTMYWDNMKAKGGGMPSGNFLNAIVKSFEGMMNSRGSSLKPLKTGLAVVMHGFAWMKRVTYLYSQLQIRIIL